MLNFFKNTSKTTKSKKRAISDYDNFGCFTYLTLSPGILIHPKQKCLNGLFWLFLGLVRAKNVGFSLIFLCAFKKYLSNFSLF
jgi:hypothetical protein